MKIKEILKSCDVSRVKGLGFDATCSMVVLDAKGEPVSVSSSGTNFAMNFPVSYKYIICNRRKRERHHHVDGPQSRD